MTVDERIRSALLSFGDPVENGVYSGTKKQYYTFSYSSIGDDFGDDAPGHERNLIQVHFFAPLNVNVSNRRRETKQALFAAGTTWPQCVDASDEYGRHIVFECELEAGVENG